VELEDGYELPADNSDKVTVACLVDYSDVHSKASGPPDARRRPGQANNVTPLKTVIL
jgi:hypothetical protein